MELEISTDMAIKVFLDTVDCLFYADTKRDHKICAWTNKEQYANFTKSNFERIFKKAIYKFNIVPKDYPMLPSDYKQFFLIFREMGWIVCQKERFTSTQWINSKPSRVITVNYPRYLCLKKMETYRIKKEKEKEEQLSKKKAEISKPIKPLPPIEIETLRQAINDEKKNAPEGEATEKNSKKTTWLDKIKEKLPQ